MTSSREKPVTGGSSWSRLKSRIKRRRAEVDILGKTFEKLEENFVQNSTKK